MSHSDTSSRLCRAEKDAKRMLDYIALLQTRVIKLNQRRKNAPLSGEGEAKLCMRLTNLENIIIECMDYSAKKKIEIEELRQKLQSV